MSPQGLTRSVIVKLKQNSLKKYFHSVIFSDLSDSLNQSLSQLVTDSLTDWVTDQLTSRTLVEVSG